MIWLLIAVGLGGGKFNYVEHLSANTFTTQAECVEAGELLTRKKHWYSSSEADAYVCVELNLNEERVP